MNPQVAPAQAVVPPSNCVMQEYKRKRTEASRLVYSLPFMCLIKECAFRSIITTLKDRSELGSQLVDHILQVEDELDDGVAICGNAKDRSAELEKKRSEI